MPRLPEALSLAFVLAIAAFARLYDVAGYMVFLGDQGRDALVVKAFLTEGKVPLLGPPSSVGSISTGALYYYLMAAAMWVDWLDPVAATVMVAVSTLLAIALLYYLTRA